MTFEKWEGDRVIAKLRFIECDGKRMLQYADSEDATIDNGEVVYNWKTTPIVDIGIEAIKAQADKSEAFLARAPKG